MPTVTTTFHRFYPKTASDAEYADLITVHQAAAHEVNPNDPPMPTEIIRKSFETVEDNSMFTPEIYLVRGAGEQVLGYFLIGYARAESEDYEAAKHMSFVMLELLPDQRRNGIGSEAMRFIVREVEKNDITLIQGDANRDSGREFANFLGATVGMETRDSRAYMTDIPWDLLEQWVSDGEAANPDVTVELYKDSYPDDLEAYSRLYTETFNQQPFEELEGLNTTWTPERLNQALVRAHEVGMSTYLMITREPNGDMSGLTELIYHPERGHRVGQGLTGVSMDYRGRSLGKWLKAKMALFVRETYPDTEFITTGNATVNAAMLSINERMGFKLHRHTTLFKLPVEQAKAALGMA